MQRRLSGGFGNAGEFAAFVDDRNTVPPSREPLGELAGQIPQKTAFSARRFAAEQRAMYMPPAVYQAARQSRSTAGMGPRHPDAQRGNSPHRDNLPIFDHDGTGDTGPAAISGADIPLPQLLLMTVNRVFTQGLKSFLHFPSGTNSPFPFRAGSDLPGGGHRPFSRRGGQEQRRVCPHADLLRLIS